MIRHDAQVTMMNSVYDDDEEKNSVLDLEHGETRRQMQSRLYIIFYGHQAHALKTTLH